MPKTKQTENAALPKRFEYLVALLAVVLTLFGACAPGEPNADPAEAAIESAVELTVELPVASVVQALRDGGRPSLAVEALSGRQAKAVPALVALAGDDSAPLTSRLHALNVAGCLGAIDAGSSARVAALLADEDENVAGKAAVELDRMRPFPREVVEAQLAESAPHRAHRHAAWVLARHVDRDSRARGSLVAAVDREASAPPGERDTDCRVRLMCAIAGAAPDAGETLRVLERGAASQDTVVHGIAIRLLGACGERGLRVLARLTTEAVDESQRHGAIQRLGSAGTEAAFAAPLLVRFATEANDAPGRALAIEALGAIGVFDADSVGAIRAGFAVDDARVRIAAATAAGAAPSGALVEELLRATRDADEDVAVAAAAGLAGQHEISSDAFEPLLADPSARVRSTRVLWHVRRAWAGRVSRDALLTELASRRLGVGDDVVVAALARFPDDLQDSWSRVAGLAGDADEATRLALVELAGRVGAPAVPFLANIVTERPSRGTAWTIERAAFLLFFPGTPDASEALASVDVDALPGEEWAELRARVIAALARVAGDDGTRRARIVAALSDPSSHVRHRVAIGIVRADRGWAAELVRDGRLDLHTLLEFEYQNSDDDLRDVIEFARDVGAGVPGVRGQLLLMARRRDLSEPERAACEAAAEALRHDRR